MNDQAFDMLGSFLMAMYIQEHGEEGFRDATFDVIKAMQQVAMDTPDDQIGSINWDDVLRQKVEAKAAEADIPAGILWYAADKILAIMAEDYAKREEAAD
jgi:hypothetical protein